MLVIKTQTCQVYQYWQLLPMCTEGEEDRQTGIVYFSITDGEEDRHMQKYGIHLYCTSNTEGEEDP